MQTVIDKIIATSAHNLLTTLALGFFLLLLIDSVTHYIRETVILRFSQLFNLHVSNSVLGHMLRLPLDYFQRRHIGDIVSRFGSLQPVREILTKGLVSALIDGLLSVVTLVVMFTYSVKLALIVLAIVFIYSACRWFFFYPIKQLNQQILQSDASQQSYFMQSIRAMRTIKLASTEARTQAKWLNHFIDNANQRIRLGQWNIGFSVVNKILFGLENLIVVYIAANLAIQNELSVGMLFAFMSYKGRFVSATATLIDQWIEYKILNVHLARLEDIVYQSTECSQNTEDKLSQHAQFQTLAQSKNNPTGASMTVSELAYQHHSNQALLFSNLHLSINSGDCIAIIGASGCGKTSLLHCLLGLNTPTDGTILLNDKRLSPQTRSLHRVAAVMQDDQLLSGSIKDNICQFDEHINIANMISAAKIACVDTDILAMTMQYETLIGDMGSSLSGGQKQRILLARALYQQPELLILDEATSHLDINTEAKVCANLKQLNTSIIMVAHRPQTIASADKIYTLSPLGLTEISYPGDDTPAQPQATNKEDPYAN
jgi:ATP-binding cassette subfamily B protein RaxB